jgi:predicted transposase YbfD/YdcC
MEHITERRIFWVKQIQNLSGNFVNDVENLESLLVQDISLNGIPSLIEHLRLCGNIPESYGHDTSEEKLYSKYTDILLSLSYSALGIKSIVLKERADAADVEAFAKDYSFVADAKSFRLSRTAKNQKDFKIQAMDGWKRGKLYAMVVCPIHQLPVASSQIYQQATSRNVCIFTYSHLAVLLSFAQQESKGQAEELLGRVFAVISTLNPSKSASEYWLAVNKTMLGFSKQIEYLWSIEKRFAMESIVLAKQEALNFLAVEREKIMRMSHKEALKELLKVHKIENKMKTVNSVSDNGLFGVK